ncbi:hypothetical protein D2Q93_14560 [Alicyclobacillaceae bacterium I2511]|nr:hypothetical protein D2Q93_14560 [Alicyclobacillaceae bacterium I2511]
METGVTRIQFVSLMVWLLMATGLLTLPFAIAHFTIQDGWLVAFVFLAGAAVSIGVVVNYAHSFPGQSLTQGLTTAFGPWLGRLAGAWVVIWFYTSIATVYRELGLFLGTTVLPHSAPYHINALMALAIAAGLWLGLPSIARAAEFITPLATVFLVLILALALQNLDWNQFHPFFADGFTPVLRASLLPATTFACELVVSLQLLPRLNQPGKLGRDLWLAAGLVSLLLLISEFAVIGTLGNSIVYLNYPVMEVVRSVRVGEFIERLDTFYVMGVVAVLFLKLALLAYAGLSALQEVVSLSRHSIPTLAMAWTACVWASSILFFRDGLAVGHYIIFVTPAYFTATLVLLPLLASTVHVLRKSALNKKAPNSTHP